MVGDVKRQKAGAGDACSFLEKLAAQGVAKNVAAFVGEITVRSVAEAIRLPPC